MFPTMFKPTKTKIPQICSTVQWIWSHVAITSSCSSTEYQWWRPLRVTYLCLMYSTDVTGARSCSYTTKREAWNSDTWWTDLHHYRSCNRLFCVCLCLQCNHVPAARLPCRRGPQPAMCWNAVRNTHRSTNKHTRVETVSLVDFIFVSL